VNSFKLDTESVREFLKYWPLHILIFLMLLTQAFFGVFNVAVAMTLNHVYGLYLGFIFRGQFHESLREKYPHARYMLLLSAGIGIATMAVLLRMIYPQLQGTVFDGCWTIVSFMLILSFVVINHKDKDVMR
jgi:hypothetical protein